MAMVTSKRAGKSNLPRVKDSYLRPNFLLFEPARPALGVQNKLMVNYSRRLESTVTSYRGKREQPDVTNDPFGMLNANQEENSKPRYDTGHPFKSRVEEQYVSHRRVTLRGLNGAFYQGPVICDTTRLNFLNDKWNAVSLSSIALPAVDLNRGSTAIARSEPTRSSFSLVRAAVEAIRDFPEVPLKALKGSRSRGEAIQNVGSEYLNVLFGLLPTANDVFTLCQRIVKLSDYIEQYKRDLGRPVRRSYRFPIESSVTASSVQKKQVQDLYANFIIGNDDQSVYYKSGSNYSVSVQESYSEEYWFKGAFLYYLDPLLENLGKEGQAFAIANQILGLKFDYKTIWELTPWSWFVDWFVNVKDLISVSDKLSSDTLVLQYGYLMRTAVLNLDVSVEGLTPVIQGNPTTFSTSVRITEKERVRSTPYGFGLNTNAFSLQQWAILGALGLTKAPKTLF